MTDFGFSRHRRTGACAATFSAFEADLLRSLAAQVIELLRSEAANPRSDDPLEQLGDFDGPTTEPEDPVLARLFPTAYADDADAAADFRRFTEGSLRDGKAAAAGVVIETLEEAGLPEEPEDGLFIDVELDQPTALSWLRALNDIRLAIGVRLEVQEGDEGYWAGLPEDDPRKQVHGIYQWAGFLQETLVEALGG